MCQSTTRSSSSTSPTQDVTMYSREKKRVSFKDSHGLEVFLVSHRKDLTGEEHIACNFSETEYIAIRKREKELSKHLAKYGTVAGLGEADLALETRFSKFRRRNRMRECTMSILLEQELQRGTNGVNIEGLAEIYAEYSSYSIQLAYNRAYQNAIQVLEVESTSRWTAQAAATADMYQFMPHSSSPTSTMEPIPYDCHGPCPNIPFEALEEMKLHHYFGEVPHTPPPEIPSPFPAQNCYLLPPPPPPPVGPCHPQHEQQQQQQQQQQHQDYYHSMPHPWEQWARHRSNSNSNSNSSSSGAGSELSNIRAPPQPITRWFFSA